MYAQFDSLFDLLSRVRDYCACVLPGDPAVSFCVRFASGQRIQHPIPPAMPAEVRTRPRARRSASIDFRSVHWYGDSYTFTATQAACVKVLWEALDNGTEEVGQAIVLTEAGSECERLAPLFIGHPAWGVMIVTGSRKGSYRLQVPAGDLTPPGQPG